MPGPYTRSKYLGEQRRAATRRGGGLDVVVVNPTVPIGERRPQHDAAGRDARAVPVGRSPFFLDCVLNLVDVRDSRMESCSPASAGRPGERYILGGENVRDARPSAPARADLRPADAEAHGPGGAGARRRPS